jgi:hypothetical protein
MVVHFVIKSMIPIPKSLKATSSTNGTQITGMLRTTPTGTATSEASVFSIQNSTHMVPATMAPLKTSTNVGKVVGANSTSMAPASIMTPAAASSTPIGTILSNDFTSIINLAPLIFVDLALLWGVSTAIQSAIPKAGQKR